MSKYSLNIISKHKDFDGKQLKKHNLNGLDHIGVYGNEPFKIQFCNNTYYKVQVKLTLDGTDILSGAPADSSSVGKMWVVQPSSKLELEAWAETIHGGSSFVFTDASNSVAAHTHGNVSSQGIIAAAVYEEGQVHNYFYPNYYSYPLYNQNTSPWISLIGTNSVPLQYQYTAINNNTYSGQNVLLTKCSSSLNTISTNDSNVASSAAAIGAGSYVNQSIGTDVGLIKPLLKETLRIRYLWWNELKAEFNKYYDGIGSSGFPADVKMIDLRSTPRINTHASNNSINKNDLISRI